MSIDAAGVFCLIALVLGYWCGWCGHRDWENGDKVPPWEKK